MKRSLPQTLRPIIFRTKPATTTQALIPLRRHRMESTASMYPTKPPVDTSAVNGSDSTNGSSTQPREFNAWQQPGAAAFDFRSDVMTTPTALMLQAIINTTLFDDVFQEDTTTRDLESFVADLTGHEAGLLVMSGTMGNQVSMRTHLTHPPFSLLCDRRSHVWNYEAGGASSISGAMLIPVVPRNNHHLTLEDVQANIILSDDVHACPTKLICLENTLNGMVMPLSEIQRISSFAREHKIPLHLDGARIWEVVAAQKGSLPDFTTNFDSVSLCFSKGLGAPIGSIIVGSKAFIARARHVRKMFGGGTRQAGVISSAARVAVEEGFGKGIYGENGKLAASHVRAKKVADRWTDAGGKLANPVETNMVWLDFEGSGVDVDEYEKLGKEQGLKVFRNRLVVHYQITDEAVEKLFKVFDEVLPSKGTSKPENGVAP